MKFDGAFRVVAHNASLPVWGEWIEIAHKIGPLRAPVSLSPCGESGLKLSSFLEKILSNASLPVWGEWIEMDLSRVGAGMALVSPRVGRVD